MQQFYCAADFDNSISSDKNATSVAACIANSYAEYAQPWTGILTEVLLLSLLGTAPVVAVYVSTAHSVRLQYIITQYPVLTVVCFT